MNSQNKFIKNTILYIGLCALLIVHCGTEEYPKNSFRFKYYTRIKNEFIEISIEGVSSDYYLLDEEQQKEIIEEAVYISAIEKLAEKIMEMNEEEKLGFEKFSLEKDEVYNELKTNRKTVEILEKNIKKRSDGFWIASLIIRFSLTYESVDSLFEREIKKRSRELRGDKNNYYTGLIINLKEQNVPPPVSQSFQIYSEEDIRPIFGTENIDLKIILEGGGVHFAMDLYSAKSRKNIVGENPYILDSDKIVNITIDKIAITKESADIILEHNYVNKFLQNCKVIIII